MAKINRGVRWEATSCELADEYLLFLKEVFGIEKTFSEIANDALVMLLAQRTSLYYEIMKNQQIIILEGDNIKQKKFTENQIALIKKIQESAHGLEEIRFN